MKTPDQLDALTTAWPTPLDVVVGLVVRGWGEKRSEPDTIELTIDDGVVGDRWNSEEPPGAQVSLIEHRVVHALLDGDGMALAGDNLIVDLDLTDDGATPGTVLHIGTAVLQITDEPHHGCAKFIRRYGLDAQRWVNRAPGRRGRYARVLQSGTIRRGDRITIA